MKNKYYVACENIKALKYHTFSKKYIFFLLLEVSVVIKIKKCKKRINIDMKNFM